MIYAVKNFFSLILYIFLTINNKKMIYLICYCFIIMNFTCRIGNYFDLCNIRTLLLFENLNLVSLPSLYPPFITLRSLFCFCIAHRQETHFSIYLVVILIILLFYKSPLLDLFLKHLTLFTESDMSYLGDFGKYVIHSEGIMLFQFYL